MRRNASATTSRHHAPTPREYADRLLARWAAVGQPVLVLAMAEPAASRRWWADETRVQQAVARLLAEGDGHPLATVMRVRRLVDELTVEHRQILARWGLAPTLTRAEFCEATTLERPLLDGALRAAVRAGLVESAWVAPGDLPSMVHDILCAFLSPAMRATTHLQLGRALLQRGPRHVIDAAHHLERATALASSDEIVDTLDRASDTLNCAASASVLASLQRPGGAHMVLPDREHAVLRLLADGLGNAEIARLYQRLGVGNRAGAVAKAHELGLL